MEGYLQACGMVLLSVILIISIKQQGKELSLLLSLFVCCAVACVAMAYLEPVLEFVQQLQSTGQLDGEMLSVLLKVVAAAIVGELAALVCNDAGNASLGKVMQMLTVAVILWLSLPMLTALLALVEQILERL